MTEDSRIREIRAELASWHADGPPVPRDVLNRIRAILNRQAAPTWRCARCGSDRWGGWRAGPEHEGWPRKAQCVPCGHVQDLPKDPPPAPQVFFPGELIPDGMVTQNEHGTITHCAMSLRSSTTEVRLRTAAHRLSPEEWQAAVDRARADRREVQP